MDQSIESEFHQAMNELNYALARAIQVSAALASEMKNRKIDTAPPVTENSIGLFRQDELLSRTEILRRLNRSASWLSRKKDEGYWLNWYSNGGGEPFCDYEMIKANLAGKYLNDEEENKIHRKTA